MAYPVYYVIEGDTLPVLFDTFDGGTGASSQLSSFAATDIEIYKDGGVTQRASDNGLSLLDTDGIDFDNITGINGFSIDLSDNSDAGFYAVGPWYHVVVDTVTVDGQSVSFIACAFRILDATRGMAGTALPDAAADAAGGLPISDTGGLDLDALNTNINDIETDTNELQTDWADGGRLDVILDARASQTSVNTVDSNVDAILLDTGTSGVVISTATAQSIADELLKRDVTNTEDSAGAHSLTTIVLASLESALSGTTWTIKKTDGTTFTTKTVATDATADPVTSVT